MPSVFKLSWQSDEPAILRYGTSFVSVATALILLRWMEPSFAAAPASLLQCAILLSSWNGGYGPGLLAIAMSTLAFEYYVIPPQQSLAVEASQIPRLVIFSLTAFFIGGLGAAQRATVRSSRRMHDELNAVMQALKQTNQALERENAERALVHEQLRQSEAFLTEGQKISHTGSWRWEVSTGLLTWSDEHYHIYGYNPGQPTPSAASVAKRIHPEDMLELRQTVEAAIRERKRFECEHRIVLPDGTTKYVHAVGCPLPEGSDHVEEYIGTTVDITARRKAENLLRRREQEYRTLAENLPDGVIRYDLNCRRTYVNPAYIQNSGLSADLALNTSLSENWYCDIPADNYIAMLRDVITTGSPKQVVGKWIVPGRDVMYFAVHIVAERNLNGEIVGMLAIIRNVSHLKAAEHRLEESQNLIRELADQNETIREEERKHLARELHDDLAQHLLALRMKISLLELEYGEQTTGVREKAQAMIGLVDSTIKVVRNAVATLRPVVLDMGVPVALEWLADEFAAQNNIPCSLYFDADNACLSEKSAISIFRIAQEALRNIARHANATKAEIRFRHDESGCMLEVNDNGTGFHLTEKKPKSFGLIGIRERVLILGGEVDIVTAPNQGTSVRVTIPTSFI